ncbi:MAG: hypothetical protein U9O94_05680 [Nanoarchaeota archaeon]|nr:hypothetical protein [Nanoarchaeota archaeon]
MNRENWAFNGKNNDFFKFSSKNFLSLHEKFAKNNDWAEDVHLPLSVFNNENLSALETITKFIKEEIGLNYSQIALLLNRDERTIWGAYDSSKKKMNARFFVDSSKFHIPISVLKDRSLSVLEAITEYLKEELNLRYCQIGGLLNRDQRTVWTVYNRTKKKRRKSKYERFA